MRMRAPITLAALALAGCAEPRTGFPSLAPRAIEQKGFEEPEAPPPAPLVADPAVDAATTSAKTTLADISRRFAAAARTAQTRAAAAKGSGAGSDGWLDAQTALAELDAIQAETTDLLSSLEDRAMARAVDLAPAYPALDTAIAAARTAVDAQSARIRTIGAGLAAA